MEDKIVHIGYEHIINKYINDGYVIKIEDGGLDCNLLYKANVQNKNLIISVNSSQYKEAKEYLNNVHREIESKKFKIPFENLVDEKSMADGDAIQYEKMFMSKNKEDIKTIKKSETAKKYKTKEEMTNKIKRNIALFLATTGVVLVGTSAAKEIKSDIQYSKEANAIVNEIDSEINAENTSENNIEEQKVSMVKEEIYERIKQEVSEATGVSVDDINIAVNDDSSAAIKITIVAGDKIFRYTKDLRSPVDLGNDYSHKIADIILEARKAKDIEPLTKVLNNTLKFTSRNDLEERNGDLKTVRSDDGGDGR